MSFPEMSPANSSTINPLDELWRSKLVVMSLNLSVESPKSQKAYNFIGNLNGSCLIVIICSLLRKPNVQLEEEIKCLLFDLCEVTLLLGALRTLTSTYY